MKWKERRKLCTAQDYIDESLTNEHTTSKTFVFFHRPHCPLSRLSQSHFFAFHSTQQSIALEKEEKKHSSTEKRRRSLRAHRWHSTRKSVKLLLLLRPTIVGRSSSSPSLAVVRRSTKPFRPHKDFSLDRKRHSDYFFQCLCTDRNNDVHTFLCLCECVIESKRTNVILFSFILFCVCLNKCSFLRSRLSLSRSLQMTT